MVITAELASAAEEDFETFVRLVAPYQIVPGFHAELMAWITREDRKKDQLVLVPRDHGKSRIAAFYAAWRITNNPSIRILYLSATSNLAEKQLSFIKTILTSEIYRRYWPNMVEGSASKRKRWTTSEIEVDHPQREQDGVRDPTIFTAGLTTTITGMHCDLQILDDVVVDENATTEEGRSKVRSQYSLLSSIAGADSEQLVVGTRYHPKDLYQDLLDMTANVYNDEGDLIDEVPIYELYEKALENVGDGSGEYLWPRHRTADGKWWGFDRNIRAQKYGKYLDKRKFWAQYYNTPNPPGEMKIDSSRFQYYERKLLRRENGAWYFGMNRLNVFAAIDFAFSMKAKADYTALVVVGVDFNERLYVLDIVRFKTDKISEYYKEIQSAHIKWGFRKLRAEVTAAQSAVVKSLKDNYIKPKGLGLSVDEFKPNRHQGSKEERISAILEPRYDDMKIFHYAGGNCQILEEELLTEFPAHDDVKDALASAVDICVPPTMGGGMHKKKNAVYSNRFGGVR